AGGVPVRNAASRGTASAVAAGWARGIGIAARAGGRFPGGEDDDPGTIAVLGEVVLRVGQMEAVVGDVQHHRVVPQVHDPGRLRAAVRREGRAIVLATVGPAQGAEELPDRTGPVVGPPDIAVHVVDAPLLRLEEL